MIAKCQTYELVRVLQCICMECAIVQRGHGVGDVPVTRPHTPDFITENKQLLVSATIFNVRRVFALFVRFRGAVRPCSSRAKLFL